MQAQYLDCALCGKHFQAKAESFLCSKCENEQHHTDVQIQVDNNHKEFPCPKCTYRNPINSIQCQICTFIFEQKLNFLPSPVKKPPKIQQLILCKKCNFENHITNGFCLNCEEELYEHVKKTCEICGLKVKEDNYEKHYEACILSKSLIEEQEEIKKIKDKEEPFIIPEDEPFYEPYVEPYPKVKPMIAFKPIQVKPFIKEPQKPKRPYGKKPIKPQKPGNIINDVVGFFGFGESSTVSCYYCYAKIPKAEFQDHTMICEKKDEWQRNIEPAHSRMTPLQVKAIRYMHQKSIGEHEGVRKQLQQRVKKLGYSIEDLDNLQFYIENYAPIIIQIHISKHMEFFVKDTHYRSQFETNKSSGSLSRASRTQWEDRMFDKHYSAAKNFERVKYGVINFTNDPKGVQCAKTYGPSYFLLKSHVRDRCTFTDKDSSGADASIATLKFGFKIVSKMNDNELKAAFSASKALQMSSNVLVTYKEVQIHGPIEFSKDIERVYASRTQINGNKKLLDLVYEFSEKFKVQHDFI